MGLVSYFEWVAIFLHLFLVLMMLSSTCYGHEILCKAPEREALLKFKSGLSGYHDVYPQKKLLASWVSGEDEDCCRWEGIGCDNQTGHVTNLTLVGVAGTIDRSLANLKYLQILDLHDGDFGGSSIPNFMGSFSKLRYLDLSSANFTGIIPPQLGNLSMLEHLDLNDGSTIEPFYPHVRGYKQRGCTFEYICRADNSRPYALSSDGVWLSHLSSVRYLNMMNVDLSEATSLFQQLNKLPFISEIILSHSNISPLFPSLLDINFTRLLSLDISSNTINGIPEWLFNVTSLEYLDLNDNDLLDIDRISGHLCNLRSLFLRDNKLNVSIDNFFVGCNHRKHLEDLVLSGNRIAGQLPSWLGEYESNLKIIDVSHNWLSGSIPESISGIKSLKYLYLSGNDLDGHIPMSIGGLSSCVQLDLSHNNFHGHIPMTIVGLTSCELLDLSNNKFNGSIPMSIGELISCRELDMSNNNLSGMIPSSIRQLYSLQYLDLSQNTLEGNFTEEIFFNHTELDYLDLSGNSLKIEFTQHWYPPFSLLYLNLSSCNVGQQFPSWLQTQSTLRNLYMSGSSISDFLPQWIWNFSYIWEMDLSRNMLKGKVPIDMNGFSSRWRIDLHSNMLEGSLSSFPAAYYLILSNNLISGSINLRDISNIYVLNISMNNISGTIPSSLCDSKHLRILDLSDNHLYGQVPSCNRSSSLSNSCGISLMYLNNNILDGSLPAWMRNCKDMNILYIGNNQFTGNLPSWISMPNLQVLSLSSNSFNGSIPSELSSLEYLIILDLANNHFSGHIPRTFGNFSAMKTDNGSDVNVEYSVYIEVTIKRQKMGYQALFILLRSIDLSGNEIYGEIPEDLGELHGLINLNLSGNHLTGYIPGSLSNLIKLESLDLSRNNLSGDIPQSLLQLTSLSSFNVSFNNLSGRIPTGNQFDTFNGSSYMGNMMLCGKPLEICGSLQQPVTPKTKDVDEASENNNYYLWLYISLVLGCITGFWIFWSTLFLMRSWRYAYLIFIDRQCKKFIHLLNTETRNA